MLISVHANIQGWGLFVEAELQNPHADHLLMPSDVTIIGEIIALTRAKTLQGQQEEMPRQNLSLQEQQSRHQTEGHLYRPLGGTIILQTALTK